MSRKFGSAASLTNQQAVAVNGWGNANLSVAIGDANDFFAGAIAPRMISEGFVYNITSGIWEKLRSANMLWSVRSFNTNVALVIRTPTAGKKFRMFGFAFAIAANSTLAVAANNQLQFTDGGVGFGPIWDIYLPAAVPANAIGWIASPWFWFPANGYLSTAANNVLGTFGITAAAMTNGALDIFVVGTEE